MSIDNLVQHFGAVEDPCCCGNPMASLREQIQTERIFASPSRKR
jgi:hypothetical protein